MPVQTTRTSNIYFPDGAKVEILPAGEVSWFDVGAINSAVTATLNWTENQVETANAGKTIKQIKEMTIEGGFTLINLDLDGIQKMGGGIFEKVETLAAAVTTIPDQVIAAGWDDGIIYPLDMLTSPTDSQKLKTVAAPTLTSVKLDVGGTPETLTAGNDYVIVADSGAYSGWGISFISAGMTTLTPKTKAITIDYASNTPIASTTIYAGSSTALLSAYAMRITHTDDNAKRRMLELFSVDSNSGGFQFNFKGANEDGLEEMPLTFMAKVNSTKVNKRQLMAFTVDEGAA
jgi:hypothetical protein